MRHLLHVHRKDLLPSLYVRARHHNLPVEAAGAQQRRIKHVRPVGGRNYDDAFIRFKTVHFVEELVQRMIALIIAIAQSGTTTARDRDDFVNVDDESSNSHRLRDNFAPHAGAPAETKPKET